MTVPAEKELQDLITDWTQKADRDWNSGGRLMDSGDTAQGSECNGRGDGYSACAEALARLIGYRIYW